MEKDRNKRFDRSNLILLCDECHRLAHERSSPLQEFKKMEECEFNYIDYVHSFDGDYEGEVFQCSNCETEYSPEDVIGGFNYCPTCGRKIKKGEEV